MIHYNKTDWGNNTKLTPALLNNIEQCLALLVNELNNMQTLVETQSRSIEFLENKLAQMETKLSLEDRGVDWHNTVGNAHSYLFNQKADKYELNKLYELIESLAEFKNTKNIDDEVTQPSKPRKKRVSKTNEDIKK